jgi:hypothetical protein
MIWNQAMHAGVIRDIEQQRIKKERQLDFEMQRQLEEEYRKVQHVNDGGGPAGRGIGKASWYSGGKKVERKRLPYLKTSILVSKIEGEVQEDGERRKQVRRWSEWLRRVRRRETLYIMAYRMGVLYGKGIMGRRRKGGAYHARPRYFKNLEACCYRGQARFPNHSIPHYQIHPSSKMKSISYKQKLPHLPRLKYLLLRFLSSCSC